MQFGRRAAVMVALTVLAAGLAGCSKPAGIDGKLANTWPVLPSPVSFQPAANVCHATPLAETGPRSAYRPVDCARPHLTETFYVGTFPATTPGTEPPTRTSAAHKAAFATCDTQARAFLGQDFRYGRLWLAVVVPSSPNWSGGARWFRCELGQVADVEDFGDIISRTGTLAGALKTPTSPLLLTCYQTTATPVGAIKAMDPIACAKPHNSEFVGAYIAAPQKYPTLPADWDRLHTSCRTKVATFVGVPNDANLKYRTGTVAVPNPQEDWNGGNLGVRCYLYVNTAKFTRSLRGAGPQLLPER